MSVTVARKDRIVVRHVAKRSTSDNGSESEMGLATVAVFTGMGSRGALFGILPYFIELHKLQSFTLLFSHYSAPNSAVARCSPICQKPVSGLENLALAS